MQLTQEESDQIKKIIKELKEANESYRQRITENEKEIAALEKVLSYSDDLSYSYVY